MARGWESKSVESQQAEAVDKSAPPRQALTPEEAVLWRQKESLRLSRETILQQLKLVQNPQRRKQLEDSLADLDEKLRNAKSA
jgi:hypothetical protein